MGKGADPYYSHDLCPRSLGGDIILIKFAPHGFFDRTWIPEIQAANGMDRDRWEYFVDSLNMYNEQNNLTWPGMAPAKNKGVVFTIGVGSVTQDAINKHLKTIEDCHAYISNMHGGFFMQHARSLIGEFRVMVILTVAANWTRTETHGSGDHRHTVTVNVQNDNITREYYMDQSYVVNPIIITPPAQRCSNVVFTFALQMHMGRRPQSQPQLAGAYGAVPPQSYGASHGNFGAGVPPPQQFSKAPPGSYGAPPPGQCAGCAPAGAAGHKFCNVCGSATLKACGGCATPNPPSSSFCNSCGTRI
jgi:hypothetical protein